MRKLLAACLLLLLAGSGADSQGASGTFTFTFKSPVSTSITMTVTPGGPCTQTGNNINCTLPLAANAVLATLTVAPAGWTGGLTLAGSTIVAIGGSTPNYTLNVGAAAITAPVSASFTITASP